MLKTINILTLLCFFQTISFAQNIPSDKPCDAPNIEVSETPNVLIQNNISFCCSTYENFLLTNPTCGTAKTNRDAWFKIDSLIAGQQYNFLYIETGDRQTWVEIYELPNGKSCSKPDNFINIACARANNVAYYLGATVSATFIPKNASSKYFVRFQRLNITNESLAGTFSITKSYPNDEPCGATMLEVQKEKGTNPLFGSNVGAADWKPEILTGPTCGPNNDVWYKFVAKSCAMEVFLRNLNPDSFEMQGAILTEVDGNCNNLIEVVTCGGLPDKYIDITLSSEKLIIGKTYYVIIDGHSPPYINAVGDFGIEVCL